jgi:serine/threonine protein kinase
MGVVYLAHQTDLERAVALKELQPGLAGDDGFAERFKREARTVGSLSHPNIVTAYEYFEHEDAAFIAMEYLERGSLRPHTGALSFPQVMGVVEGLLAGLGHAASRGVVHRDLKPENLLISAEGTIKIADFGIARIVGAHDGDAHQSRAGAGVGTPTYMAPEQVMAEPVGPWTDLYATGVIVYELLLGQPPFREPGLLLGHATQPPPSPGSLNRELDLRLASWLEQMLAKRPQDRPSDANAAWEALEEIVGDLEGARWRRQARLDNVALAPTRPVTHTRALASVGVDAITAPPRAGMKSEHARRIRRGLALAAIMVSAFAVAFAVGRALSNGESPQSSDSTVSVVGVAAVTLTIQQPTTNGHWLDVSDKLPALISTVPPASPSRTRSTSP